MLGAVKPGGGVGALGLLGTLPLTKRVHTGLAVGGFVDFGTGKVSARDAKLTLPLLAVNEPDVQFVVTPGVSLPLGSSTAGLNYTLLTTGSFDPTLGLGFAAGGAWLVSAQAQARLPLHPGFDRVQQGLFFTASARGARRVGGGGVHAGVAFAGQLRRGFSAPGFAELAPTVGFSAPLGDRWGLDVNGRVPVWVQSGPLPYWFALQVSVRTIVPLKKKQEH